MVSVHHCEDRYGDRNKEKNRFERTLAGSPTLKSDAAMITHSLPISMARDAIKKIKTALIQM